MAFDTPISYTKLVDEAGKPTRYFYQFLLDMWTRIGGSAGEGGAGTVQTSLLQQTPQPASSQTLYQLETAVDYAVTGDFDREVVVTTNGTGTSITVTMPVFYEMANVEIIRAGLGQVTIDGNGTNLAGLATQDLPMQYDAANMIGSASEWVLI